MFPRLSPRHIVGSSLSVAVCLLVVAASSAAAQTTAALQGRVFDTSGGVIPGASITLRDGSTRFAVSAHANADGRYSILSIPAGIYTVEASASGLRSEVIESLTVEVGRTLVRDFYLSVGKQTESVVVHAELPLLDRATSIVGHVVTPQTIQEIPLNGRHFIDLSLLVPGSVAPSQTGFSTTPIRGVGSLAVNTAGNREESVAFLVNGVTTNNLTFGSLGFQMPIAGIQEFKVDNSTFSGEYGHVSGAVVNLVTRSGNDEFHGNVYDFVRNDALDARNFFEFTSSQPHPFELNQFGGAFGGPLLRGRTFFFTTYEGLRQRQGIDMNSLVLSDEQRANATDPAARQLIDFIPRANFFDAAGTPRFVGSANASVDLDTCTIDIRQNMGAASRFQAFVGRQELQATEPSTQGTTVPGFGLVRPNLRRILTLSETHVFGTQFLNEVRFGRSSQDGSSYPAAGLNPASFGIGNGIDQPLGLPQIVVAGGLNFGGPATLPQGRNDTLWVLTDTMNYASARHSVRFGGEFRRFVSDNFAQGTGMFNFPSVAAFMTGTANAFNITLGERRSYITQDAVALFVQDQFALGVDLTLDLGVRYEWHVTPTERDNQFVVFDADTASLVQVGVDIDRIYQQNNANVEPRVGVAWSPSERTVVRAAYALAVDQPGTSMVRDTTGNPPFAIPVSAAGAIPLSTALTMAQPSGLAPSTVDPQFRNASRQSWNVNVQRQLARDLAVTAGYLGARGLDLRITRNINQPVNGTRPFTAVSAASPITPGVPLGNIMQVESTGFSTYNAVWISATKRLSSGLLFDTSYTLSKSLDTNSLNSSGFAVQDSYDISNQYGPSDFDARHRFVLNATYELPFTRHALARGWQLATIVQYQSGNPVNIVTSNSALNGMPNTVRPNVTGPVRIVGTVDQWFDPAVFVATNEFGNLGRNAVTGPSFFNTDISITKLMTLAGRYRMQFRADVFDVFNHPNFGPPGNIVGTPTFGKITRTRMPTGEAGSSRQIQLALKFSF